MYHSGFTLIVVLAVAIIGQIHLIHDLDALTDPIESGDTQQWDGSQD